MPNYLKIFLLILIILPPYLFAETYVSGEVSGTWTQEGSSYYVVSDSLIIPYETTLTLSAGVEVRFTVPNSKLYVHGGLISRGTSQDSVYIFGDEGITWMMIELYDTSHTDYADLEYTLISDAISGIEALFSNMIRLNHCKISTEGFNIIIFGVPLEISDSILEVDDGSNTNIHATNTGGFITNTRIIGKVELVGGGMFTFIGDTITGYGACLKAQSMNVHIENCFAGYFDLGAPHTAGGYYNITAINNTTGGIIITKPRDSLLENNTITNYINLYRPDSVQILGNRIGTYIRLEEMTTDVTIERNTILGAGSFFIDTTISVFNPFNVNISNNIITGYNGIALRTGNPSELTINYNDIFVPGTALWECEPGIGNIFDDPMVIGGNPLDYNLACGSAAVDAGDPASPLDPDSTRADIGVEFFDWRENHPPNSFISCDSLEKFVGDSVEFYVWAYDDAPGMEWHFDMPEWLSIAPGLDVWQTDTVHISGTVPPQQESFTVQAITEDAEGLTDTVSAYVFVYPTNYLSGSLSGVLDVVYSPYIVYEDITVEEDDTLTIAPGVELQFMETGFDVYGKLVCEGTAEDSITFTTAIMEPEPEPWDWIVIFHDYQDTIRFSYCIFEYSSQRTVEIDSGIVHISNCSFYNNYYNCIYYDFDYETYGLVEFNYFDASNGTAGIVLRNGICRHNFFNGGGTLSVTAPGAIAEYNLFYESDMGITASSNSIVRYNQIHYIDGYALYNYGAAESPIFHDNYVKGCGTGATHVPWLVQASKPQFYNNVFEDCEVGYYSETSWTDTSYVYNNVFRNCDVAFESYGNYDIFTNFENNSITDCDTAFKVASPDHISFQYNNIYNNGIDFVGFPAGTGALTGVNANGDSCDVGHNIYLDPMFGEGDPFDYHLHDGSPLIDAGNPDPGFFDPDSTINDIGLYGGFYGESYPYLGAIFPQLEAEIPSEFTLTQNFPNPFNNSTNFIFTLPEIADVNIGIYNVLGQLVKDYSLDKRLPGVYRVEWDGVSSVGEHVSSGIYLCTVDIGDEQKTITMMLVK